MVLPAEVEGDGRIDKAQRVRIAVRAVDDLNLAAFADTKKSGFDLSQAVKADQQSNAILLVEDTDDNRLLIKAYLKKEPYEIDEAENGEIAVEKFKQRDYGLVLMDVQMPVMDGHQATRTIREWEAEQGRVPTPIIALTAHAIKEEMDKSLAAGCNAHLTKPIKKATLIAAIEEYLAVPA